jgi:hypothetical protein
MYLSIPRAPAIAAIRRLLEKDPTLKSRTSIPIDHIISLLDAILRLAHFQWQGVFYALTEGCAMGDSTSTPLSNAYITEFEIDVLNTYRNRHDPPANPAAVPTGSPPADQPTSLPSVIFFWFRQADDTMMAIHRDHVASFLKFLNSVHANIKWTIEREEGGVINMLDLTILHQTEQYYLMYIGSLHIWANTSRGIPTNLSNTKAPLYFPSPDALTFSHPAPPAKQMNSKRSTEP